MKEQHAPMETAMHKFFTENITVNFDPARLADLWMVDLSFKKVIADPMITFAVDNTPQGLGFDAYTLWHDNWRGDIATAEIHCRPERATERWVMDHEMGHALGLNHESPAVNSVMQEGPHPTADVAGKGFTSFDILNLWAMYGVNPAYKGDIWG